MLTWCRATLEALLAMGHLFPHLMFVGPHEHELYTTLKDFYYHSLLHYGIDLIRLKDSILTAAALQNSISTLALN